MSSRTRVACAALLLAVAVGWWLVTSPASPVRPVPPAPHRPVLSFLARAARLGLYLMWMCDQPQGRSYGAGVADESVLRNEEGW